MAQLANLTTTLALESASFVNGIEQSRGAVRNLIAQLDPAAAAQAKFNRQMDLAARGLKSGQLSTDLYEKVVSRLRQRMDEAAGSGGKLVQTSGQMRAGMQQLGYQLGDISQGFAVGTSAATIFAQQSGQVVQALQLMTAESKGVIAFLGGPWGAVLSAALVAATPFVAKLFEGNGALDDQVDKLRKSAEQSRITDDAKAHFANTLEGVTQAIRDQRKELDKLADADKTAAERAVDNSREQLRKMLVIRETTAAIAAQTLREAEAANQTNFGAAGGAGAGMAQGIYAGGVEDARRQSKKAEDALKQARLGLTESLYSLSVETAKRMANPVEVITKKYNDQISAIQSADRALIQAGKNARADSAARITALEKEKQLRIEEYQESQRKSSNENRQTGRQISLGDAERIVTNIGGVITSATRSFAKQSELYNNYLAGKGPLAAKPGSSDHEGGNALDIAKTPGMSLGKIRKAFTDAGVSIKQLLDEGNHFHVAWKAGADEAAKAERKLNDTLLGLQGRLDPAAKAASDYHKNIKDIGDELAARKISPELAKTWAKNALDVYEKALQDAREARAKNFTIISVEENRGAYNQQDELDKKTRREVEQAKKRGEDTLRDQGAAIGYARDELAIRTLNNAQRNIELARLAAIAGLERDRIPLQSEQGRQIIFNAEQLEMIRQKQDQFNASLDEANRFGSQFLSDVLDPSNWDDWGNAGKRILQSIEQEFVRLALLNPLKNALFGENNPTLGSVGGIFSGLFGDKGAGVTPVDTSGWGALPGFAAGGSFQFGGRDGIDRNILSLNGSPIARVSKGETAMIGRGGSRDPVVVQLVVGEGQMFESRVQSISGDVAIQTVADSNRKQAFARERSLAG